MMQANLFISNFKKILSVCIFIFTIYCINKGLSYILIDDTLSYTRCMIHELYNQKQNVDILFLGSSHCYRSIDTNVTDEIFNTNTFNAGTSAQWLDGTYTLLKEAEKNHNLSEVYIEIYYDLMGYQVLERTELTQTYIISDYMRPSINKITYLTKASSMDYWINGFFPARREWNKLFEPKYVSTIIGKKQQSSYKNFSNVNYENEYYAGKGYVANILEVEKGTFVHQGIFEPIEKRQLSDDDRYYINKIIEYCKRHNIKLTFFSAPMPDFRLVTVGNYDNYIHQIRELLEKQQIPYYDFNLCKPTYLSLNETDFLDTDHLNAKGAKTFSKVFADVFMGNIEPKEVFYMSYQEKLDNSENNVYGINYIIKNTDSQKEIELLPVCNKKVPVFFTVDSQNIGGGGTTRRIQSCSDNNKIILEAQDTGKLFIKVYTDRAGTNETNSVEISY